MSTAAISFHRRVAGNARHNPLAATGVALVVVFVIFALFAPWIAPQDPAAIDLPARLDAPSHAHWFGTDELGRDIFSRIVFGARISMMVGSCVVLTSLALGLIIGSIAGHYGGGIDRFVNVVLMNAFMSFPGILLAIAFVAFRGPRLRSSPSAAPASSIWFSRSHSEAGSDMRVSFADKSWLRASANSSRPRVLSAPATCASSSATFCRISFSL